MEDNNMGVNTYDVGTLAGLNGIAGGFYGNNNGALYDTILAQHTQAEVRREGDQSANRDGFAATQTVLQGNRIESMFFQSHLDSDRKFQVLNEQIQANAVEALKCCCETQKLTMQQGEATRALMQQNIIDGLRSQVQCHSAHQAAQTVGSTFVNGNASSNNNSGFQGVS